MIEQTDNNVAEAFETALPTSAYSVLAKTFRIAETDGWDQARIHWLRHFDLANPTTLGTICLFGKLEDTVFKMLEEEQRYYSTITCNREDCPNRQQLFTTSKIDLL